MVRTNEDKLIRQELLGKIVHPPDRGHRPGVTTILSAKPRNIAAKIDADANIAYYLRIGEK